MKSSLFSSLCVAVVVGAAFIVGCGSAVDPEEPTTQDEGAEKVPHVVDTGVATKKVYTCTEGGGFVSTTCTGPCPGYFGMFMTCCISNAECCAQYSACH